MDDNLRNEENIPWKTFPGKHSLDTVKVKVQDESGNFFNKLQNTFRGIEKTAIGSYGLDSF